MRFHKPANESPQSDAIGETPPSPPLWKRRGWQFAAVVWLVTAFPMSVGPAAYLDGIGLTSGGLRPLFLPLTAFRWFPPVEWWMEYAEYCYELGQSHR